MALIQIDLATGEAALSDVDGGPLEAWEILLDAVTGPTDPADAPVALVTGAVGGLPGPGLARTTAIGLSPLSGAVAETRAEGPFAAGLRRAGVTGVVLHGRAPEPVVVVIENGRARLEPATGPIGSLSGDSAGGWPDGLVGLETGAATDALLARYGADAAVAVVGPAAWRGVRYASVVTCREHPLPRLGFGAVLAAKRVAAVVCKGSTAPVVADPEALERIGRWYAAAVPENPLTRWQHEVPGFGVWSGPPGYAAVAGFADTSTPGGLEPADAPPVQRVATCPGCPTECMKVFAGAPLHQEALAMLGAYLGAGTDPFALNARCLQLGVDPVSFAGTAAAAGVAPGEVPAALEDLAAGDRLGLGNGAAELENPRHPAMVSKRVELPPFDPRVQPNLGLGYAVAPIGPRYDIVEHDLDFDADEGMPHCFPEARALGVPVPRPRGELDPDGTAVLLRLWSGLDALGVCLFAATPTRPLTLATVRDLVAAVTGERPDVLALGQRRLALQRAVNQRLGIGLEQDTLPERFFTEPVAAGRYAGSVLDRDAFHAAVSRLHTLLAFD
jgi:aldehyde:ferredoxin oxidoreductase